MLFVHNAAWLYDWYLELCASFINYLCTELIVDSLQGMNVSLVALL